MNTAKLATIAAAVMMIAPVLRAGAQVVPGAERRWTLDFRMTLDQPGGGRPVPVDLRGDWILTVTAVRPGQYDVELELANAKVSGMAAGNAPRDANQQLERRLQRPFWVTCREHGALLSVHFYKDVDPGDRNLLQMTATEMQFVNAPANRQTWTTLERDGAGEYQAGYSRQSSNTTVKKKVKYTRTDGAAGSPAGGVHVDIEESEARFSLDSNGGILSLDGRNRVRVTVSPQAGGQLTAVTEIHLANFRGGSVPERIGSLSRVLPDVETAAVVTHASDPAEIRARLDRQLLEGRTAESVLTAAVTGSDDRMLPDRLAALFRQRPETIASALDLLRKSGPQKMITTALGSAGTPAAVGTLATVASDRALNAAVRIDALTAFMFMQHPCPEAMRAPLSLLDDPDAHIASAARIVSGGVAQAGRAAHPAESREIDASLVARFRKAREIAETCDLLTAMGNSVGATVLPAIEDGLRDARTPVRAAAARALRLASGPGIDALISKTITGDSDPEVRNAAIIAAGFHHPLGAQIGQALVHAAKGDTAEPVRSAAVTLLRHNPGCVPDVAQTLAWVAAHDSKLGMRKLAAEALASIK